MPYLRSLLALALFLAAPGALAQGMDCNIAFAGPVTVSDSTPDPGQRIRFTVSVINWGTYPSDRLDVWFVARREGAPHPVDTRVIASGVIPPETTITRVYPLRLPSTLSPGTYFVDFHLGSFEYNAVCDFAPVTLTVGSAAAWAEDMASSSTAWRSPVPVLVGARADVTLSAVSAFPNPFQHQTALRYTLADAARVRLAVFDALGREVAVLVDEAQPPGLHAATFDARGLPAGVYVVRLTAGREVRTERVTVLR